MQSHVTTTITMCLSITAKCPSSSDVIKLAHDNHDLFSVTIILPFLELDINGIVPYIVFRLWLFPLSVMFLGLIHAVLFISIFLF